MRWIMRETLGRPSGAWSRATRATPRNDAGQPGCRLALWLSAVADKAFLLGVLPAVAPAQPQHELLLLLIGVGLQARPLLGHPVALVVGTTVHSCLLITHRICCTIIRRSSVEGCGNWKKIYRVAAI